MPVQSIPGITVALLLCHSLPPLPPPTVPAAAECCSLPCPACLRLPAGHVSYTTLRKQALVTELQVRGRRSQG